MNDRYFDLGNLAVNNGFDDGRRRARCSSAYFGEAAAPAAPRRAAADARRCRTSARRCGAWSRRAVSELDFDYARATRPSTSARARRAAADPRLEEWLRPLPRPRELPDRARVRDHRRRGRRARRSPTTWPSSAGATSCCVDRAELTSGSTFHSAGLVGQLRGSRLADADDDVLRRALPAAGGERERPGLGRVRRHPARVHARARGGDPPPGRLGEDVRAAAGADLRRRGAGAASR